MDEKVFFRLKMPFLEFAPKRLDRESAIFIFKAALFEVSEVFKAEIKLSFK